MSFTLLLLIAGATLVWQWHKPALDLEETDSNLTRLARDVVAIEKREKEIADTVWAGEMLAQQHGRVIIQLWDRINAASNQLGVVALAGIPEIVSPAFGPPKLFAHEIRVTEQTGSGPVWTPDRWKQFIQEAQGQGWQLVQSEFRHVQFDIGAGGQPNRSRFDCSAHLVNSLRQERAILHGVLIVLWEPAVHPDQLPAIRKAEVSNVQVKVRFGQPAFEEILVETVLPPPGSYFIDPLILYDLDGDGLSEIILASSNLAFHRQTGGGFAAREFCRNPPGVIFTGIMADFDGDGHADFVCARFEGLFLFKGSAEGTFDAPERLVWAASPKLRYVQALTCGDIDHDGDLDLWLGQYKVPYDRGQMPTPYYDARDGFPSYLLRNDGHGNFSDATPNAGLGSKRWRRVYGASFLDLNQDQHLDLVVASDFAGVDLFLNDGQGNFSDVTQEWVPNPRVFGMSQLCADFNLDGHLDLLVLGMNVPVVDRLLHFGRARPGFESYLKMGRDMTYGNRLLLGQAKGPFQETPLNQSIARSGWSWGAAAFDFDNDAFPDVHIVNGHETKQSTEDYETEFWLHDIYVGNSKDDLAAFAYFKVKSERTRGRGMSYGGYEKNRLYWNQRAESFLEIGHLMGVALEQDSRNVIADDLDGDGRLDLLVTTFEAWPEVKQTLRVFRNTLATGGNWIGFHLRERGQGRSPVGARVTVRHGGKTAVRHIATGESYRSQQANTVHFGLGSDTSVEHAEIQWLDGRARVLRNPEINRYHAADPPSGPR